MPVLLLNKHPISEPVLRVILLETLTTGNFIFYLPVNSTYQHSIHQSL